MILNSKFINLYLFSFVVFIVLILLRLTNDLSISYKEAIIFFDDRNFLHYFINFFTQTFGQNDFSLRIPFIILYLLSTFLLYKISKNYFSKPQDRLYATILFMIIPGVFTSAILVNSAIIIIFLTLLYLYLHKFYGSKEYIFYPLLLGYLFIDNAFAILFLSIFIYSIIRLNIKFAIFNSLLFGISLYIYGFESSGKPHSYFLDTFAIYGSIFSPFIFLYFLYSLYRVGIKEEKTIYWMIPTVALGFSLIISFRQKILIEDFAPFLVIAVPMMTKIFLNSYRVRLKSFRIRHNVLLGLSIGILVIVMSVIIFNKQLYFFMENPKKNFAYNYHFAKEVADVLKSKDINKAHFSDKRLEKRVMFYGIKYGRENYISNFKFDNSYKPLQIRLNDNYQVTYYVKKYGN